MNSQEQERMFKSIMNRKAFEHLPGEENPQFLENGKMIYHLMKSKYPNENTESLDNILNGICASLTYLMRISVHKDNHKYFLQLVHNILSKNTELE
jgi:uncharacterized Zn-finger protein